MAEANPILEQAGFGVATTATTIDTVREAMATHADRAESNREAVQANLAESSKASKEQQTAISNISIADQLIAMQKDNADLNSQIQLIEATKDAVNTEVQTELLNNVRADAQQLQDALDAEADSIGGGIGGIFKAMLNQEIFGTPGGLATARVKNARAQLNASTREIQDITAATESITKQNLLTAETLSRGTVEANQFKIANAGIVALTESQIKNTHSNASVTAQVMAANARQLDSIVSLFEFENQTEQLEMQKEMQALRKQALEAEIKLLPTRAAAAEANLARTEEALLNDRTLGPHKRAVSIASNEAALKEMAEVKALQTQQVLNVQNAQSLFGLPIQDSSAILGAFGSPVSVEQYTLLSTLGSTDRPTMGNTPWDAFKNRAIVDPAGIGTPTKGTKWLDQVAADQNAAYTQLEAKNASFRRPTTEAELKADFNAAASSKIETDRANVAEGDLSNVNHAPPMETLIQSPAVSNDPFYQRVLAALNMQETNGQSILDAALTGMRSEAVTPEQAAKGVTTLFRTAISFNNSSQGGLKRVGVPNQDTYKIQVRKPTSVFQLGVNVSKKSVPLSVLGLPGGNSDIFDSGLITVDLTDISQVQNYLVQLRSSVNAVKKEEGDE